MPNCNLLAAMLPLVDRLRSLVVLWQIVDEEQRVRHGQREELAASERRGAVLAGEVDELRSQLEVLEKTRKMTENELREIADRVADLTNANAALLAAKKKTEVELQALHVSTGVQPIYLWGRYSSKVSDI